MGEIAIDRIPSTLAEFTGLQAALPGSPEGAAAAFIVALLVYSRDSVVGEACLAAAVHHSRLSAGGERLRQMDLALIRTQVYGKPQLVQSYFRGTSPAQGYKLPAFPLGLEFSTNPYSGSAEEGEVKLFVPSSGADSPRPLRVRLDESLLPAAWRAVEWSSLLVGIRAA